MANRMIVPIVALVCLVPHAASAQNAPPTVADLSAISATGQLTTADEKTIDEYVKYWIGVMKAAKAPGDIEKARKALIQGYGIQTSAGYGFAFAKSFSTHAPAVLTLEGDPLRQLKEVNVSLVAAQMSRASIMPMLSKMLAHKNPAARYWAAKAFRGGQPPLGELLLVQGGQLARDMLAGLEAAARNEKSGNVFFELLRAMEPYVNAPEAGGKGLSDAQGKVLLARCADVHAGDVGIIRTFKEYVLLRGRAMDNQTFATADRKTFFLQVLADALEAASLAFLQADTRSGEAGEALRDLLIELEAQLAAQTKTPSKPIKAVLDNAQDTDDVKAAKVRLAVNTHWKGELKNIKPGFVPPVKPAADTAPAKPAAAPATGPAATAPAEEK